MTVLDKTIVKDLRIRVDHLLDEHPVGSTTAAALWGAQYDAGLAWIQFPLGLGGLGLDIAYADPVEDMLVAAGVPRTEVRNLVGVCTMAPTLAQHGTREQCERHLRKTFTCEEIWCQLFSEPGAGSDLAALGTRAERDGDQWVITGQKVWTTLAHKADFGILLARTNPDVPKHAGITFFLLDMHLAGVEVRPLRQITGEAEYNEVYLTDVRLDDCHRLGAIDDGWRVALDALTHERRIGRLMVRATTGAGPIAQALEIWHAADPSLRTPQRRDRLAKLWINSMLVRLTAERADAMQRAGQAGNGVSIGHMGRGPLTQGIVELCMELRGASAMLIDNYDMHRPDHFTHISGQKFSLDPTKAFLAARSLTIAGGSTEITKNATGERVLGLPPEPRVDRHLPWSQSAHAARQR